MNTILRSLYLVRSAIWSVRCPLTFGVKALVLTENNKVLLVKHTYKPGWHIPGGKLEKRETIEDAARRELYEETGVSVDGLPGRLLGTYSNLKRNGSDHVSVFVFEQAPEVEPKPQPIEIEQVAFFPVDDLPEELTEGNRKRILEATGRLESSTVW